MTASSYFWFSSIYLIALTKEIFSSWYEQDYFPRFFFIISRMTRVLILWLTGITRPVVSIGNRVHWVLGKTYAPSMVKFGARSAFCLYSSKTNCSLAFEHLPLDRSAGWVAVAGVCCSPKHSLHSHLPCLLAFCVFHQSSSEHDM